MTAITRRQAILAAALLGAELAGCGSGGSAPGGTGAAGSTLRSTWGDPGGVGVLSPGPGEPLVARVDLAPRRPTAGVLTTMAHVTDAHVLDASSPARITFLDRLGAPFTSTFRPQETLTVQVLSGAVASVRSLRPDLVIQGGDLIDNDQRNELGQALAALRGGLVRPGSGPRGYFGVQLASDADPFYYRPDLDAPRHPGLLTEAVRPVRSSGLAAAWCPVLGDHDILLAGEIPPTPQTAALALGDQAVWELPSGLKLPPGTRISQTGSPDGPPVAGLVDLLFSETRSAPKVRVPADPRRVQMDAGEVVSRLAKGSGVRPAAATLDYHVDLGRRVRVIVLDLARRGGGSGGLVRPDQIPWLAAQLRDAGERWVIAVSHQPLTSSEGGEAILSLLDRHPRVVAALAGHIHRNRITPRRTTGGGYWLISTASLIDYPQQARALRLLETEGGGVALQTWMLDHDSSALGQISRGLAYLDAQGGRPGGFAGGRLDRNVTLFRGPPPT